jgi:hypothetical protein
MLKCLVSLIQMCSFVCDVEDVIVVKVSVLLKV